jgi:1,4-alpha-glucan branching enzyme
MENESLHWGSFIQLEAFMTHIENQAVPSCPRLVPVRFEYTNLTAASVSVAGSFNNWQPENKRLHSSENGRWFKETALAPGAYEYRFVVDGKWLADPMAKRCVDNPFGGKNSVLYVKSEK